MLDEIAVRKIKSELTSEIDGLNVEISRKQKEIDEAKKKMWTAQAKLGKVNKILEDEA